MANAGSACERAERWPCERGEFTLPLGSACGAMGTSLPTMLGRATLSERGEGASKPVNLRNLLIPDFCAMRTSRPIRS